MTARASGGYAVEERREPCKILASAASLAALRDFAWRRLLSFFFAFPARAPMSHTPVVAAGADARLNGLK
jgi:hypothetical protein